MRLQAVVLFPGKAFCLKELGVCGKNTVLNHIDSESLERKETR